MPLEYGPHRPVDRLYRSGYPLPANGFPYDHKPLLTSACTPVRHYHIAILDLSDPDNALKEPEWPAGGVLLWGIRRSLGGKLLRTNLVRMSVHVNVLFKNYKERVPAEVPTSVLCLLAS